MYFWRTAQKQEIDYLEEDNQGLRGFEIKYKKDKFKIPQSFLEAYAGSNLKLINKNNYKDFVL